MNDLQTGDTNVTKVIRKLVQQSGLSQGEFARKHKISPPYLFALYRGEKKNPSAEMCKKLGIEKVEYKTIYLIRQEKVIKTVPLEGVDNSLD